MFPPRSALSFTGFSAIMAFTLVELLTVLAIIGLLAGLLMPAAASVRQAAAKTQTRLQFSQWAAGIEAFRQEYGAYPVFHSSNRVNGGAEGSPGALHPFHDILAGRRRDGSPLPPSSSDVVAPQNQNQRRVPFVNFSEADLFPESCVETAKRHLIRDAFEGTDIVVLVDRNLDGFINQADYATRPSVSPPDNPELMLTPEEADFPALGLRTGVVFYCAPRKATHASQLLLSWK